MGWKLVYSLATTSCWQLEKNKQVTPDQLDYRHLFVPVIPTHQNTVQTSILLKIGFLKIKLERGNSWVGTITWMLLKRKHEPKRKDQEQVDNCTGYSCTWSVTVASPSLHFQGSTMHSLAGKMCSVCLIYTSYKYSKLTNYVCIYQIISYQFSKWWL